jgi:ribosomal protein L15
VDAENYCNSIGRHRDKRFIAHAGARGAGGGGGRGGTGQRVRIALAGPWPQTERVKYSVARVKVPAIPSADELRAHKYLISAN